MSDSTNPGTNDVLQSIEQLLQMTTDTQGSLSSYVVTTRSESMPGQRRISCTMEKGHVDEESFTKGISAIGPESPRARYGMYTTAGLHKVHCSNTRDREAMWAFEEAFGLTLIDMLETSGQKVRE